MKIDGKDKRSLWFEGGRLKLIDQRKLPYSLEIFVAKSVDNVVFAINEMVVRGAPAIGAAAAYGMVMGSQDIIKTEKKLQQTRPTAFDLFYATSYMKNAIEKGICPLIAAEEYVEGIINRCRKIGRHGEKLISDNSKILTHCNAGALATVDYGTALAPIRAAHAKGKKIFVYADETRPRCQGLLTAWELKQEGIPNSIIVDNAAGYYMQKGEIDIVIVGADRIAKNGDFANKIGTYEKAIVAKENSIPFYVAAPESTFDQSIENGSKITIEERNKEELIYVNGKRIMPEWASVKNPAFDITPKKYVTGYITERGIIKK
ncbi:MAG: S-methyl-5-thioribose-1-phosphate isomerase [Candidatus Thermoplasmatota archaeon]|nr:S-methyl-5-thioribose-1-phosphate isomerase [Candidatus Thermoplasmatota archaeon]